MNESNGDPVGAEIGRPFWAWFGPGRLLVIALIVGGMIGLLAFGPGEAELIERQQELRDRVRERPWTGLLIFVAVQIVFVGLSIPSSALLSVLAGFLFGRGWGILAVAVGNALGATLAFLAGRYLFRELVARSIATRPRYAEWFRRVDDGVRTGGAYYLFLLRLTPVVPYFVLNFACGLTRMRTFTFWWVSQLGMIPVLFVWVNVGAAAAEVRSARDMLSAEVVFSLSLLTVFPWIAHFGARLVRRYRPEAG